MERLIKSKGIRKIVWLVYYYYILFYFFFVRDSIQQKRFIGTTQFLSDQRDTAEAIAMRF